MLYLLDTADVREIARCVDLYPVAGVTTNPTLIARAQRPIIDVLTDIRQVIGEQLMLHVQVTGSDAGTMVAEAHRLRDRFGSGILPKVPVTPQGLKAIRLLAASGFSVTATIVGTPQQALLAARAGAAFTAPYVNRLDTICGDGVGVGVVASMVRLFSAHGLATKVLAASFRNVQQVLDVALAGAQSATMTPEMFNLLLLHPLTESGLAQFVADWSTAYGAGTTLLDLIPACGS
jgi:fructose-6-phosphate aldolase 2